MGIDHHNASSTQAVAVGIVESFVVGSGVVDGIVVVAVLVVIVVVLVIFAVVLVIFGQELSWFLLSRQPCWHLSALVGF